MEPIAPLSWEDLPAEVLEIVFSKIDSQVQLGPLRLVNSSWRNIINRSLKYLSVGRRQATGGDIESLGRTFTRLEKLTIYAKDEDMLHKLSSIKGLTQLVLMRFPCARSNGLELLTNLSVLKVSFFHELKPNFLEMLCTLRNLKHLDLFHMNSWNLDSSIEQLSSLTNLTSLHLRNPGINSIEFLSGLTNLEVLNLAALVRRYVRILDCAPLSSLVNLTRLHLSGYRIGSSGVDSVVANLKNLTHLGVTDTVLKIDNLATLTGLSKLTHLDLSRNDVTDEEVLFLTGLGSLKKIILDGNRAMSAIQLLAPLTGLEVLRLNETLTQGTDLMELSNFVGLKEVIVGRCQIGRGEFERVSAALPHIRFRF